MSQLVVAVLALAALGSSALSAVTGVAGGTLLLSTLLVMAPAAAVVPLHGAVQSVACASRVAAFRTHIRWDIVGRVAAGLLPGSLLGLALVTWLVSVDARVIKLLVAGAILFSLLSKKLRFSSKPGSKKAFWAVGIGVGFLGVVAGSTGPVVSQTLLRHDVNKEEHVATKAAIQGIGHGLKIPLFGLALDFDFGAWLPALLAMGTAVLIGTYLGKKLLGHMSAERFVIVARTLLALVVIHIAASQLYELLA